jgi:hypothetical protein
MTDGDDRARESWAIYLVDGALAASERSGGPHRYHYQSPDQVACCGRSLGALFGTYPLRLMKAQNLARCVMIENPA